MLLLTEKSDKREVNLAKFFERRDAMANTISINENSKKIYNYKKKTTKWLTSCSSPLARNIIKNVGYNSTAMLIGRIGAIVFTIIIARLLQPSLYGLYMLAISTAVILVAFTDLGINTTLFRYMSSALGKSERAEARGYFMYLLKLKFLLATLLSILTVCLASVLATFVFRKPELSGPLKIMAGFVFFQAMFSFLQIPFQAAQEFKYITFGQIAFQGARLLFSPLLILLGLSVGGATVGVVLALASASFLLGAALYKKYKYLIIGQRVKINRTRVLRFLGWTSITTLSVVFFVYIDTLMIGALLSSEQVAYYQAAWAVVFAAIGVMTISSVLFPIFTQLRGKALKRVFKKTFKVMLVFSILVTGILILLAAPTISALYGKSYMSAVSTMQLLSVLVIIATITSFHRALFNAIEKPKTVTKAMIVSLIINVVLNYILILKYGIIGAAVATVISRTVFAGLLVMHARQANVYSTKN